MHFTIDFPNFPNSLIAIGNMLSNVCSRLLESVIKMFPAVAAVAVNEALVVDILPEGEEGALFNEAEGRAIGNSITRALFSSEDISTLRFESSGLDRGRFRIVCADTTTRD